MLKNRIRKLLPRPILWAYHFCTSLIVAMLFGFPARRLRVIGVTGTTGKTTTANYIAETLRMSGKRIALATTANFRIADRAWLNAYKQTMLGRVMLAKFLRDAVREKCEYLILEVTSEGIEQSRHIGIPVAVVVFTNLYPEHIESHGSFENYKRAKLKLMARAKEVIVANADDASVHDFIAFPVRHMLFSVQKEADLRATDIQESESGVSFRVNGVPCQLHILGNHHVSNALAALAVLRHEHIALEASTEMLSRVHLTLGRMEFIDAGQPFHVIVDYAFEPVALERAYQTIKPLVKGKLTVVIGSTGGGRDRARRPKLGALAAKYADHIYVTNEDPYDDDPLEIIHEVSAGAVQAGAEMGTRCFEILDRREAITRALTEAVAGDMVFISGKGCEQAMVVAGNKKIPWDDRTVVRETLAGLGFATPGAKNRQER